MIRPGAVDRLEWWVVTIPEADWYRQATVYQIYPRSFADSDGDGVGDLTGALSRVDYLSDLGVDAVWLSPFYPSGLADGGYDVDDYRNVDPRLGTLDDFDRLVDALHRRDIRLIIDIVPNHSGAGHPWFQQALAAGRGSRDRDRYVFRDGTGPDGAQPPTDWMSIFGGSAWQRVEDGQWYLHTFDVAQPDWNWDNSDVIADFEQTLRFWADRGVDGFRVDVAFQLKKDLREPLLSTAELQAEAKRTGVHRLQDRDEVLQLYRDWRGIFDSYDPPRMAVAEAWVSPDRLALYASPETLGQAFTLDLLLQPWDAEAYRATIDRTLQLASRSGSSSTWVLNNHDVVRSATRFGLPQDDLHGRRYKLSGGRAPQVDPVLGLSRARAAVMLIAALPGSTYLYQGEELGLPEVVDIPPDRRQDPAYFRSFLRDGGNDPDVGRDGCRVPLPWTRQGVSFGFGAGEPFLPQPAWFGRYSVDVETDDPASTLRLYRRMLRLRRRLQGPEELTWLDTPPGVLHFRRPGGWECLTNFSSLTHPLPAAEVLLASGKLDANPPGTPVGGLPPNTTVWLRHADQPASRMDGSGDGPVGPVG